MAGARTLLSASRFLTPLVPLSPLSLSQILLTPPLQAYLTAAAAIGATQEDVRLFIKRLDKVLVLELLLHIHLPHL